MRRSAMTRTDGSQLELLVIQASPFCNLDCDYCYLPARSLKARMSEQVLGQAFRRAFESSACGDRFTVVWHAGEPLAVPISFYRRALEMLGVLNERGVEVSHSIQTNGTLVSEEWCGFIQESGFRVGVSVDGPAFLHDQHRKTRSARGTHAEVMRGIRLLQRYQIPFHVISVITGAAVDFPDELFEFYLESGIRNISFNVEEIEGGHRNSSLEGGGAERRFREFLSRFYDLVADCGERFAIREFDGALAALCAGSPDSHPPAQQTTPFSIVSVDWRGNFSTYSPEFLGLEHEAYPGFSFGNVLTDSFDSMQENEAFLAVSRDLVAGVNRCRETCQYFPWCGGDGPVNKLFENGSLDSTETMYCRLSKKAVIDVVIDKVEAARKNVLSSA